MQKLLENQEQVGEICAVCPSKELAHNIELVCQEKGYQNVSVFIAVLDDGLEVAKVLKAKGAQVLVSRKGTGNLLEKYSGMQVVQIHTTMNDYLRHLHLMKEYHQKVGIVEYTSYIPELEKFCRYIGREDITLYSYGNTAEYKEATARAIADHNTLLLGGGALLPHYANLAGIPHQIVENTLESIHHALETAQQLVNLQKQEREKRRQYKLTSGRLSMVLDNTNDGILSIDKAGIIQVANRMARKMLQLTPQQLVGKNVEQLLPEISGAAHSVGSGHLANFRCGLVSVDYIPQMVEEQEEGALYILRRVQDVQRDEQRIRLQLYKKGHVARYRFADILGDSATMQRAKKIAYGYAQSEATILLDGETGTGKELFAQSIHNASPRSTGPFVAINCASLGKELLESQLFGYVEGAFTGAAKGGHPGLFEIAHGGTIFLDEIGEIPTETQTQLLRVLQEKEARRIGSDYILPVNVRVITATNRDLNREVELGHFRKDLYYRINVLKLTLPPLRERGADAEQIAQHYLAENFPQYCDHVMTLLGERGMWTSYAWPGNIRELLGILERVAALLRCDDIAEIDGALPESAARCLAQQENSRQEVPHQGQEPLKQGAEKRILLNKEELRQALALCHYHRGRTAEMLGCSRSTLWRSMKRYGL